MTLHDAMTSIVKIASKAVGAKVWFFGRPKTNPALWPAVIGIYASSNPTASGNSTRSGASKLQRNSRKRVHTGTLYVLVSEAVQDGTEQAIHEAAQQIMDAFDADETLRGMGDVDLVSKFSLGTLITFNLPIAENGANVLGIQAPFEFVELMTGPAPDL